MSEDWIQVEAKRKGLFKFIEYVSKVKDVYFVTMTELIDWMKNSLTATEYSAQTKCKEIQVTACGIKHEESFTKEFTKKCNYTHIAELDTQDKQMVICDDVQCPVDYPWVGRI